MIAKAIKLKEISLTQGKIALVDDVDFDCVNKHRWAARKSRHLYYAQSKIDGKNVSLHAFLLNPPSNVDIDHIDGNGLNNQRSNLRICSHMENMANQKRHSDSKSPFKGIWRAAHCDRWAAQLVFNGKKVYLGVYKNPADAALAYDKKAKELFGPFARLNFPELAR